MSKEALKKFKEADWERIQLELAMYAVFKTQKLRWKTAQGLPRGLLPEDLVINAIQKTLEGLTSEETGRGIRNWDPEKYPDLMDFLKSVIDSDVNALVLSEEHRLTNYSAEASPEDAENMLHSSIGGSEETAESLLSTRESAREEREIYDRLMNELRIACSNDEDEIIVLEAYRELADRDISLKPAELVKYTGLSEERVRNARRRIERKTRSVRARLQEKGEEKWQLPEKTL